MKDGPRVFEAEIKDGVMRGEHTEVKSRGRRYETGTFEVERRER